MVILCGLVVGFRRPTAAPQSQKAGQKSKAQRQDRCSFHVVYLARKTIQANAIVLFGTKHLPRNIEIAVGYTHDGGYCASVTDFSTGDVLVAAGNPMPKGVRMATEEPKAGFKSEEEVLVCLMKVTQRMVVEKQQQKSCKDSPTSQLREKCPSYEAAF